VTDRKTGVIKREGLIKPEMMQEWLTRSNVERRAAWRRSGRVAALLQASGRSAGGHGETIRVLHTLTPLGGEWGDDKSKDEMRGSLHSRCSVEMTLPYILSARCR
jgi:hypothetical protein